MELVGRLPRQLPQDLGGNRKHFFGDLWVLQNVRTGELMNWLDRPFSVESTPIWKIEASFSIVFQSFFNIYQKRLQNTLQKFRNYTTRKGQKLHICTKFWYLREHAHHTGIFDTWMVIDDNLFCMISSGILYFYFDICKNLHPVGARRASKVKKKEENSRR